MSTPVTQSQFFEAMQKLDDKLQDTHRRQREHIDKQFDALFQMLRTHEEADHGVERRVMVIETERTGEKSQAVKRGTWAGLAAASGLTVIMKFFEHYWGKP